jgi:hypothetical protein
MQSQGLRENIAWRTTNRCRNNLSRVLSLAKYKNLRYTTALTKSLKMRNYCFPENIMSTPLFHLPARSRLALLSTVLLALFLACSSWLAHAASERTFPVNVKRGTLVPRDPPDIIIDGKPRFLASGARIRDENNHFQHLSRLDGQQYIVNYTENRYGDINQIWILTPEEIRATVAETTPTPKPQPRPIQNNSNNQTK